MAIIAADRSRLPLVRRLEAAGFRAWPAARVSFDGSWQIRITPGHPSRRLNCLVPLDPFDYRDIDDRLAAAGAIFEASGKGLCLRQSPLCPREVTDRLADMGWHSGYETLVMTAPLDNVEIDDGIDHLPVHDVRRFSEACVRIDRARDTTSEILASIISAIEPAAGLFLTERAEGPVAVGICVQDHQLAGIQQLVVEASMRRKGLGRELMASALRWARRRGANQAWLQVIASNETARALYEGMGFTEAYRYAYWKREPWA
jgi:GNAT superfamily N-acetyltransferase